MSQRKTPPHKPPFPEPSSHEPAADTPNKDYDVGYGRPPKHSQFQKGQSGNHKGRPPQSKSRPQILKNIAEETHEITLKGKRCKVTTVELAFMTLAQLTAQGNRQAMQALEYYIEKYDPQPQRRNRGFMMAPAPMSVEDWLREYGGTPPSQAMDEDEGFNP